MRFRTAILSLTVALSAFGFVACGEDDEGDSTAASSEATTSASDSTSGESSDSASSGDGSMEATVSFIDPEDGATTSDAVMAEVELEGFELDAESVGKAPEDGHGHLHFSMDGGKFDFPKYSGANGELAKELGVDGMYSPSTEPTITYEGLPPGEHTLEVYLANNDHSETGVETSTTFTVE